jgi:hypothetical protein
MSADGQWTMTDIPGVKWGRPEWVPSAAYWAAMSEIADTSDDFVVRIDFGFGKGTKTLDFLVAREGLEPPTPGL